MASDEPAPFWQSDRDLETDPMGGWSVVGYDDSRFRVPRLLDVRPLEQWDVRNLHCVLLELDRYFVRGYSTRSRGDWEFEHQYTLYHGGVCCPPVDSPHAAYSGVSPQHEDGSDWFWTGAADDMKKPGIGYDTLADAVRAQTSKLARGLRRHAKDELCECEEDDQTLSGIHADYCPVAADDWLTAGGAP